MSTDDPPSERSTVVHFVDDIKEPIVTHDDDNEQSCIVDGGGDLDVCESPSKSKFKCKYCSVVPLKKLDYLKHLEENCKGNKSISLDQVFKELSPPSSPQVSLSPSPNFFSRFCSICAVSVNFVSKFYDPENLEKHLQTHLRPRPPGAGVGKQSYICTISRTCQESFYSPTTLSIHLRFTHQFQVQPSRLLLSSIFSKIPKLQLKRIDIDIDDKLTSCLVSTSTSGVIKFDQEKLKVYQNRYKYNNVVDGNCTMTMVMDNKDDVTAAEEPESEESFLEVGEKTHNNNNINLSSKMVSSSNSSSAGDTSIGSDSKKTNKKKICHRCRKKIVLNSSVKHECKIDNESTQEPNYACKLCPNKYFYRDSARRHLRNNHEKEIAGVEKIGDYVILLPKSKKSEDDHNNSKKKKSKNKKGSVKQEIDYDNDDEDHSVGDFVGQHLKVDEEPVAISNQPESKDRYNLQNSFSPTPTLVMVQEVIEPQNHEKEIDDQDEISTVQMPVAVVVEHYNSTPPSSSTSRHDQSISPEKYDQKSSSSSRKKDDSTTQYTNFVICAICAEICLDRKDHSSHLKDAHDIEANNFKNPSVPPSCPVCEKKMQHMYSLRRHLTCQHVGYIDDIIEKKMKERDIKSPNNYASNSVLHHVVKEVTIQRPTHHHQTQPTAAAAVSAPFNVDCQICHIKFTKYESLEKHLKVHSNEKPGREQNCPLCDKKLCKPKGVFSHLLKVHHKDAVKQANENNLSKEKQQQIQFHILNDETPSVVLASGCAPEMPLYPTSDFGPLEDFIPEDFLNSLNVNEPAGSTETFTSFQSEAEFGAAFDNFDNEYQPQQVEPTNLSPVKHQKIATVAVANYSPNSTVVVEQQNPNSDIQIVYQNNNLPREFYGSPESTSTPPQQQQYNYPEQNYSPSTTTNVYSYNYTAGSISAGGQQQVFFSPQPQQQVQIYSSNYSKQQSTTVVSNNNNKNSNSFSNLDYLATAAALSAPAPAEVSEPPSQNSRASSTNLTANYASSPPQMHLLSPSTSSNSSTSQTPGSYQHYLIIQPLPSGGGTNTNSQPQQQLMPLTNHFYSPQPYNPILKIPKVPQGNQNQQQQQQTIINYNPEPINYHMQINHQQQQQQHQQQQQVEGETLKINVMSPSDNLESNANKRKVSDDEQLMSPSKLARVQSGPNLDPDIFPVLCPFPDCGFRFKNNKQQRSHYKINHEGLRFKCTQEGCSNTDFKYKDGYIKHLKKSHSIELDKEAANKITPVPTIPNSVPIDTLVKNAAASSSKALGPPPPPPPYQPPQYQQQQQQQQHQQQSQQIIQENFKPIYQTTEVPFNPPIPPPKKSKKYLLDQANYNLSPSQQHQQQQQPPPPAYNQNIQIQEILKSALEQPSSASIAKKSAPPKKFNKVVVDSNVNVKNESNQQQQQQQQQDVVNDDFFDFLNSVPTVKAKKSQPPPHPRPSLSSDYVNNFKVENKNESSSRFSYVSPVNKTSQPVYGSGSGSSVNKKRKKFEPVEPAVQSGKKNKRVKKFSELEGHFPCDELVDGVKCTKVCKQQRFLDQHKKMVHGPTMFPLGSLPKILPDTEVKTS